MQFGRMYFVYKVNPRRLAIIYTTIAGPVFVKAI
jgi:hypothetical protein